MLIKTKTPFLWRLDSNKLKGEIKEELKQGIGTYMQDNESGEVSPVILWDACKAVLSGKIIIPLKKKIRGEKFYNLEHKLAELEKINK